MKDALDRAVHGARFQEIVLDLRELFDGEGHIGYIVQKLQLLWLHPYVTCTRREFAS